MANVGRTRGRAGRPRLKPTLRRGPSMDFSTLLGVSGGFAVIGLAMYLGGSAGSFVNLPGILIVLCGTILVTSISFTLEEVTRTQRVMLRAAVYQVQDPAQAVLEVMELAEQARRKGVLDLQTKLPRLSHNAFLQHAMSLVVDGLPGDDLDRTLTCEAAETMQRWIVDRLRELKRFKPQTLVRLRYEKLRKIGAIAEQKAHRIESDA